MKFSRDFLAMAAIQLAVTVGGSALSYGYYQAGFSVRMQINGLQAEVAAIDAEHQRLMHERFELQAATVRALVAEQTCRSGQIKAPPATP
jgi:hypothetical protein